MKPTSAFKLKKTYKRMAAFIADDNKRRDFIKVMISAQLAAEAADRQPLKLKDKE